MRYLLIIFSLVSLSFSQLLPSDDDIAQMSSFKKQMLYEKKAKSPMGAVAWGFVLPTAGYAYINNWSRGLLLKGTQYLLISIGMNNETYYGGSNDNIAGIAYIGAGVLYLYQFVDVYKQTNKYNEQLHNKIFQKDKKLSYLLLPTLDGAYLNLSYKF